VGKTKLKLLFLCCFIVLSFLKSFAQDAHFSQFYAAPLYLNPAYTGGALKNRIAFNSRIQYPQLTGGIYSNSATYDLLVPNTNSGLGVSILRDYINASALASTGLTFSYAYLLPVAKGKRFSLGVSAGLVQRSADFKRFTYEDQLLTDGTITPTSEKLDGSNNSVTYPDFTLGAAYTTKNWYAGLSASHINRPLQYSIKSQSEKLAVKYTANAGYKYQLFKRSKNPTQQKEVYIIPNIILLSQGQTGELNFGTNFQYDYLLLGFYFRNTPDFLVKNNTNIHNSDAIIASIGCVFNPFTIGYSYDSHFHQLAGGKNASHEISVVVSWDYFKPNRKKRYSPIPCPKI